MDLPRESSRPGIGEQVARAAVAVFLLLSMLTLSFGLGWAVHDLASDDAPPSQPAPATASSGSGDSVGAAIIDEIVELLETRYVDKAALDPEALREAAIDGIIRSLNDSHTEYLTPAELQAGALNLSSSYDGIGATVSDRSGAITIVAPFRDSPAEKAGIRPGDIILEVDGVSTEGWTQTQAVQVIRGPSGTQVTLKVKHTDGTIETITVTRGNIPLESVFLEPNLEVIPGESGTRLVDRNGAEVTDIAYIAITQFHDRTLEELREKAKDIEAQGYRGLIVDLRGNPGGLLQATVDVADEFLNQGVILSEVDADGQTQTWSARRGGILTDIPVVILQDEGSASGAEVFAAALRDNGRATIIGTRSFGKGTVNQLQELKSCGDPKGCGALYISVGRWLTPKGDQIEGLGVKPDIEVPMSYDDYVDQGDIQLFRAIDFLRGN
ncbi:MAG: carboxyl-terminal processing protease [Tepidiforma sp.]|nr:MAG: carboxyl-terminal processing protease [Tepidiforma sp.]